MLSYHKIRFKISFKSFEFFAQAYNNIERVNESNQTKLKIHLFKQI